MNIETSPQNATTLKHLSYPTIPQQLVECVFGSERREALHALRLATLEQWSYIDRPTPQVRVRDADNREVLLQYDHEHALLALHLKSGRGQHGMSGDCELAQRLTRASARALGALLERTSRACMSQLTGFANGTLQADTTYNAQSSHRDIPRGGFEHSRDETATVGLPGGVVTVVLSSYTYRADVETRHRHDELNAQTMYSKSIGEWQMMQHRIVNPPGYLAFTDYALSEMCHLEQEQYAHSFYRSDLQEESFKVALHEPKLDALAALFGIEPLSQRFVKLSAAAGQGHETILWQVVERAKEAAGK